MKKPKVVTLTSQEREELIEHIKENSLNSDDKQAMIELIGFSNDLMEKLKSSKISINKLKEMLGGFKSDKLKKLFQIH
jgi:hypothetical protein